MKYTVTWKPDAESALADLWLHASDREGINRAAYAIDRILSERPTHAGTVSFDTVRQFLHWPLGVEFEVIEDDKRVIVLSVWDTDRGPPDPTGN
jgi:plasmid stabilization system protein ParE